MLWPLQIMRRSVSAHTRTGLMAEALCRLALRLKGYRILAARWRCPQGEIDILATRGDTLAVVEVKARPTLAEAAAAIRPHQQARLARAGAVFLARNPSFAGHTIRFDAMLVLPRRWPRHIENAWEGG